MAKLNLTYQTFGRLFVLEQIDCPPHIKKKQPYWRCKCDCGQYKIISTSQLKYGKTQSCGCLRREVIVAKLPGKKFGKLTVIKEAPVPQHVKNTNQHTYWLCKCECGTINAIIRGRDLQTGHTKSCGCNGRVITAESAHLSSARRAFQSNAYRDGDISFEIFYQLSQQPCYYCGTIAKYSNKCNTFFAKRKQGNVVSNFAVEHGNFYYNGLDRVDNTLPHNIDNVVSCCKQCNYAKRDKTTEEFKQWICKIYNHFIVEVHDK